MRKKQKSRNKKSELKNFERTVYKNVPNEMFEMLEVMREENLQIVNADVLRLKNGVVVPQKIELRRISNNKYSMMRMNEFRNVFVFDFSTDENGNMAIDDEKMLRLNLSAAKRSELANSIDDKNDDRCSLPPSAFKFRMTMMNGRKILTHLNNQK